MRHSLEGLEPRRFFAAGDVNPAFGAGGSVQITGESFAGEGPGLLAVAGGKVIAVESGLLERFNADGSLDTTFGQQGQVALPGSLIVDAQVIAGGKLLVAGDFAPITEPTIRRPFLARYNADGSPDTTFGEDGIAWFDDVVAPQAGVQEFAVQSDGRIVVRGSDGGDFATVDVFRLTADGALDGTFTRFHYGTGAQEPSSHVLKVRTDDAILIGGTRGVEMDLIAVDHGDQQFTLTRLSADGLLDTTFGDDGFFNDIGMNDLVVLPDGSLLTAAGDISGFTVAKLTSDGQLFPGFGTSTGGVAPRVLLPLGGTAGIATLQLDASGRALINAGGAIFRIDPSDGSLDSSFGRVIASRATGDFAFEGALVRADGDILVAVNGVPFSSSAQRIYLHHGSGTDSGPISFNNGTISVSGTGSDDIVLVDGMHPFTAAPSEQVRVLLDSTFGRVFDKADVDGLVVDAQDGADVVSLHMFDAPTSVMGGPGDDRITSGGGADSITGGTGYDRIDGGPGDDTLVGNDGRDWIRGQDGNDTIFGNAWGDFLDGGAGNDVVDGGGYPDRLTGGPGADTLRGGLGHELFFTNDDEIDHLFGDAGLDSADADEDDVLTSIETT